VVLWYIYERRRKLKKLHGHGDMEVRTGDERRGEERRVKDGWADQCEEKKRGPGK
jgi:hypothetical protein